MNKLLIILIGVAILVGVTMLVGFLWNWVMVLAVYIGVFIFGLMAFGRYGILKLYLKTYSLRTILYTNPFSAILYSVVDPHSKNQSSDLEEIFPSEKSQQHQESEELPPFHFKDASEVDQK